MKATSTQLRWFRLRRSGLVEPFTSPEEAAHRLIGVQAQMLPAAALAIWNRTPGLTHADLKAERLDRRTLVRFWGQRETLHLYAARDWPFLHTVFERRQSILKSRLAEAGLLADFRRLVARIGRRLAEGEILTHKDIHSTESPVEALALGSGAYGLSAATLMQLVREGVACHGAEQDGKSGFVHREHWLPGLDWSPPPAHEAMPELAVRFLSTYGPTQPSDLAYWYDTTVAEAKGWIESAGSRCSTLEVEGRTLCCAAKDLDTLTNEPPPPPSRWPVRLLGRWDPMLLALKDKSWLIDNEHKKKVWRPGGNVEATLLIHGRIAGTWRYDRRSKGLRISLSPFAPLTRGATRAVERQAKAVAKFFGLELAVLDWVDI